jgi:hypothetical protein
MIVSRIVSTGLATFLTAYLFSLSVKAQDAPFVDVPTKATMISNGKLPAGTRLEFTFAASKDNEMLLLHRCGDPCNTPQNSCRTGSSSPSLPRPA